MAGLKKTQFVCVDCESTGLDPHEDRILEVAAVRFTFDEILESYESLIDPQVEIPPTSIEIHNITPEMVEGKPVFRDVLTQIRDFVGDHIVVGHGILFDLELLTAESRRCGVELDFTKNRQIDTLRLARLYGQSPGGNSLRQLAIHFNVPIDGAHRAMNDVRANVEVFKFLSGGYRTVEELFQKLEKPIRMRHMPLGKHKGRPFSEVPEQYLRWMANKKFDKDLTYSVRSELSRRKKGKKLFHKASNPFEGL